MDEDDTGLPTPAVLRRDGVSSAGDLTGDAKEYLACCRWIIEVDLRDPGVRLT